MSRIRNIADVADWGLCTGCGACASLCERHAVDLVNVAPIGIRPRVAHEACEGCGRCLSYCPGYRIESRTGCTAGESGDYGESVVGPSRGIWEGHASDPEIRHRGSSGGVLTALASYCLEREGMDAVIHTGMAPDAPWANVTVESRNREELLSRAGSRYSPSSPCDAIRRIEESDRRCVFIGRPCDAAAIDAARADRPRLDRNLGAVLTFFCAGPPSSEATKRLLRDRGVDPESVAWLRYRGEGWPGRFTAADREGNLRLSLTYEETWGFLAQQHRSFRCHLCPDGLGEISDVASGDAWHRKGEAGNPGESIVVARSERGERLVRKAAADGYLELAPSDPGNVVAAQELVRRRVEVYGRLLGMRILGVPVPIFEGFGLRRAWLRFADGWTRFRTVAGTMRRILLRGLWHRNPPIPSNVGGGGP